MNLYLLAITITMLLFTSQALGNCDSISPLMRFLLTSILKAQLDGFKVGKVPQEFQNKLEEVKNHCEKTPDLPFMPSKLKPGEHVNPCRQRIVCDIFLNVVFKRLNANTSLASCDSVDNPLARSVMTSSLQAFLNRVKAEKKPQEFQNYLQQVKGICEITPDPDDYPLKPVEPGQVSDSCTNRVTCDIYLKEVFKQFNTNASPAPCEGTFDSGNLIARYIIKSVLQSFLNGMKVGKVPQEFQNVLQNMKNRCEETPDLPLIHTEPGLQPDRCTNRVMCDIYLNNAVFDEFSANTSLDP